MVASSTKPSNLTVAPFRAANAVDSWVATTWDASSVAERASLVARSASRAACPALSAASFADCAAVSAVVAAVVAFVAAALAVFAASSAGLRNKDTGALTTSSPRIAGRLFMPSRLSTTGSSSTLCDSALMALINSCFSAFVSAIVILF